MNDLLLKALIFTPSAKGRWGLPALFEGKPGTGKTTSIEDFCAACGLPLETFIGSLREPPEVAGLQIPIAGADANAAPRTVQAAPSWAVRIAEKPRGVVFLDELNTAAPSVQAAMLRVVLEGVVGEFALPKGVRFIAAMNATEDAAGGWDLAPPLANRFGHFKSPTPSVADWTQWLLTSGGVSASAAALDPEAEEQRVLAAWPAAYGQARGTLAGFMQKRPELLFQMPKADDSNASKAWPSPRTWSFAARAMASAEVHGVGEMLADKMLSAFVGEGPAAEFANYRRQADLPDPAELLDEKVKFVHDKNRLDRTSAVLMACSALVISMGQRLSEVLGANPGATVESLPQDFRDHQSLRDLRLAVLWLLLDDMVKKGSDLVVPAVRALNQANLAEGAAATPVLQKLHPSLIAAGYQSAMA